jgi:ATP-dependent Clp protease, protease subunit
MSLAGPSGRVAKPAPNLYMAPGAAFRPAGRHGDRALDDAIASETAATLMALDANDDAPIAPHIDSAEGTLEAAFILIDTIDLIRSPVRALCRGQVGGPAIGVVSAAQHRIAAPHTRFRLCQPTAHFTGTPEEIAAAGRQQQDLLWRLHARLAQRTGRPAEEIAEHMRRGRYLDAYEALDNGLIDEVTAAK